MEIRKEIKEEIRVLSLGQVEGEKVEKEAKAEEVELMLETKEN